MRHFPLAAAVVLALVILVGLIGASRFNLSALAEPSRAEVYFAAAGKHYLVRSASRAASLTPPAEPEPSTAGAERLFGMECAFCHGRSGPGPMDVGGWMNPKAVDLGSPEVQNYSDRELFWIVKNGIRLSGMPAFGRVESDEHLWKLVHYLRTLPAKVN